MTSGAVQGEITSHIQECQPSPESVITSDDPLLLHYCFSISAPLHFQDSKVTLNEVACFAPIIVTRNSSLKNPF